jgi:hypothetical protein
MTPEPGLTPSQRPASCQGKHPSPASDARIMPVNILMTMLALKRSSSGQSLLRLT